MAIKKQVLTSCYNETLPCNCGIEVLGELMMGPTKVVEYGNWYNDSQLIPNPEAITKKMAELKYNCGIFMVTTNSNQKREAKELKKLGFRDVASGMGNEGKRITIWVKGAKKGFKVHKNG